jgi:hypothetical protein
MALAYFQQLTPHPITVDKPTYWYDHHSDYGWYVSTDECDPDCDGYTNVSACRVDGTNTHTFDDFQPYDGDEAAGAFGACVNSGYADPDWMMEYVQKHDVGSYRDNSPSGSEIQSELDGGALVLLSTYLTPPGHVVIVRGYTEDGRYIVNDPWGDKSNGTWNHSYYSDPHCGEEVVYTWSQMNPHRSIALYGPEYLPYLYKTSSWDSLLSVQSGASTSANVEVCFVDSSGSFNRSETNSISTNGSWNLSLSDVFGSYSFNGSGVVVRDKPAVSTIARRVYANRTTSYTGVPAGGSDAGWDEPEQTVYVPAALRNYYGWNSSFYIQNTSGETASGSVEFYDDDGTIKYTKSDLSIEANARQALSLYSISALGSNFAGSAVITLDRPVAVTVLHYSSAGYSEFNAFTSGATTLHLPSLLKNYYGWVSAVQVQNIGDSGTYVRIRYSNGHEPSRVWVQPRSYCQFIQANEGGLPSSWIGSAQVFGEKFESRANHTESVDNSSISWCHGVG